MQHYVLPPAGVWTNDQQGASQARVDDLNIGTTLTDSQCRHRTQHNSIRQTQGSQLVQKIAVMQL